MGENENRYVLDPNTGEVLTEIHPGDRLLRAETIDYLHSQGREFNKGKTFVKLYDEAIPLIEKYLTPAEIKYLLVMAQHVSFKDCVLRKTNNAVSEPISGREFAQLHNYNYDNVRKVFKSLKKKGILVYIPIETVLPDFVSKCKSIYLINPYIYFRGEDLNDTVKAIFDDTGWKELVAKDTIAE